MRRTLKWIGVAAAAGLAAYMMAAQVRLQGELDRLRRAVETMASHSGEAPVNVPSLRGESGHATGGNPGDHERSSASPAPDPAGLLARAQLEGRIEALEQDAARSRAGAEARATQAAARMRYAEIEEAERSRDPEGFRLVSSLYERGARARDDASVAALETLLAEHPQSWRAGCARVQLAERYMDRDDLDRAEGHLVRALAEHPDELFRDGISVGQDALFRLGLIRKRQGRMPEAIGYWQELLSRYPHSFTHSGRPMREVLAELSAGQVGGD